MCVAVLVGPDEACGCSMTEHTPWYCLCLAYHTSEQVPSLPTYLPVISNMGMATQSMGSVWCEHTTY